MKTRELFKSYVLSGLTLKNRIVMAPMTRSRALENLPNELMAEYYAQRSGAGLIITEGTSPSPNGLGYARIPGIFTDKQVENWKKVTDAVHEKEGKIFLQLMHTGRISHHLNMQEGSKILSPSAIKANGEIWTDKAGMQPFDAPIEMDDEDIDNAIDEYGRAAGKAMEAGFDGVEIHAANGYLIEQFLHPSSNQRLDEYGGSYINRFKFLAMALDRVIQEIGSNKTGVRLSPYSTFNDMAANNETEEAYLYYIASINKFKPAYLHFADNTGNSLFYMILLKKARVLFDGTIIFTGGLNGFKAEEYIREGLGDLAGFGRHFVSNPDLADKLAQDIPLTELDPSTLYSAGPEGYTDYTKSLKAVL